MNNSNINPIYFTKNLNKCLRTQIILRTSNNRNYDTDNLNDFSKRIILPLIFIYKTINFKLFRDTFYYIYYYFKNGIIVHINNNKLKCFDDFNNKFYFNPFLKEMYFNEKDAKQLQKLELLKEKGKIDEFFKLEKKNIITINEYFKQYKVRSKMILERRKWVPDGHYFINSENEDIKKNYLYLYLYFFEEYVKYTNNNNLLFFLNLRNFPISRKDNIFPLKNIKKNHKIPYKVNFPILSFYTSNEYNDIPIPFPWDIRYIFSDNLFPDITCAYVNKNKLELNWDNKFDKLCFRGYLTGDGNDYDTNIRIKAYEIGLNHKDILDIGITEFRKQIKKSTNQSLGIIKTKYFTNNLTDYEQSFYKYILILEGHFYASVISYKLNMKCCIFLQNSDKKMWYSDLLKPYKHYIPIKQDLSNLVEQTKWCLLNDSKCKNIAKNGYNLIKKILTREYIFKYMNRILNKNCTFKIEKSLKVKNKIAIILIYKQNRKDSKVLKFILKYYKIVHPYIDIFVIEQMNQSKINYGLVKNIGFDLIKNRNYDYFIFSNIYYIPDDELSHYLYNCKYFPLSLGIRGSMHEYIDPKENMSYYENTNHIKLEQNISNMICFDKKTFIKINGYPNEFQGISGENIILLLRIYEKKLKLFYPKNGRLINIYQKEKRIDMLKKINEYIFNKNLKNDGLYNIKQYYNIINNKENHFKINILKLNDNNILEINENIKSENILNKLKKIKCIYI